MAAAASTKRYDAERCTRFSSPCTRQYNSCVPSTQYLRLSESEGHEGGRGEEEEQGGEQHADLEHQELPHVLRRVSVLGREGMNYTK